MYFGDLYYVFSSTVVFFWGPSVTPADNKPVLEMLTDVLKRVPWVQYAHIILS
jgi:hypothetical protein